MKKKITVVVLCLITILAVTYFSNNNFREYNTSITKEDMVSFFGDNEQLFVGIKEKLDNLALEYIEISNDGEDITYRGYYEKDKDNKIEISDKSFELLCKEFFFKS